MSARVHAEFASAEHIIRAARELRALGYRDLEGFTPFPLPELESPLGIRRSVIPRVALAAAVLGMSGAFGVMYYTNAVAYRLDVGGRPLDSWPTDIPIMFETAVLLAAVTAFGLCLVLSGLPRLYAPIFEVEGIERVSVDRYFLRVGDLGSHADLRAHLLRLGAVVLHEEGGAS